MKFDSYKYGYPSRRKLVYGRKGMVATSQPLAAQAGLDVLKKGGNAIDAAVAAAACLTVVEPTSNGIGGDAFALVWSKGKLYGLNASGPAPEAIPEDVIKKTESRGIPKHGWVPVTVPGAPSAWAALSRRFGRLSLAETLSPAVTYAFEGYPVSPTVARSWGIAWDTYNVALKDELFRHWFETFAPTGRAPRAGELWASPAHGRTLQAIGDTNAEAFYRGELTEKIVDFVRNTGGYLSGKDFNNYGPEWVEPVSIDYRSYNVWEIPPNGHGIVALMTLNILKGFDFSAREAAETYHKQLEAMKLAYADGRRYIADQRHMKVSVEELLSEDFASQRRRCIGDEALMPVPGQPPGSGTVYLAAADGEGNMVSYIQSNYMGFGSGIVVPGTGISFHNRGCNFSTDPTHENCIAPGKKPYHTIIPGFLTRNGEAIGPFGVMGGFMQPQGHVQVIMNAVDFHMNPQDCLDAPRWQWIREKDIEVEQSFPSGAIQELTGKGHNIKVNPESENFGRGQIIWRDEQGTLAGGTEPRADGTVAVW
ncbi:MAG TPA: gamma-glutamyltransferase family protein [Clostridia bacterium]|nr:gamma-glutamyltransferase family protein [Clostridia bacterium]